VVHSKIIYKHDLEYLNLFQKASSNCSSKFCEDAHLSHELFECSRPVLFLGSRGLVSETWLSSPEAIDESFHISFGPVAAVVQAAGQLGEFFPGFGRDVIKLRAQYSIWEMYWVDGEEQSLIMGLNEAYIQEAARLARSRKPPYTRLAEFDLVGAESHWGAKWGQLLAVIAFIHHFIRDGKSVAVNCAQGKSRSSTIVIAYEMKLYHLAFDQAFANVRGCRAIAEPNLHFQRQLREFESDLRNPAAVSPEFQVQLKHFEEFLHL